MWVAQLQRIARSQSELVPLCVTPHASTTLSMTGVVNFLVPRPSPLAPICYLCTLMEYNFSEIETKWQGYWAARKTFAAQSNTIKPKYYVLDMFPYPSGAGLHVGHPLGYIASDIVSRYKRLQGFNVLHPMGYDAFGLPAEQYAIQTGQHPEVTTKDNIARYREQLDKIGFAYDWDREVRTSDPAYYKWTQWIFMQLFKCYYNTKTNKAEYIDGLVAEFAANGTANVNAACSEGMNFSAEEWNAKSAKEQQEILMNYRLAYQSFTMVNWCEALGTVLANDEVVNGVSERGGYPVERKPMRQWSLRITAYADRLLEGLERIDWSDALKEQQRNWIGRSEGAMVRFSLIPNPSPNSLTPLTPSPVERGSENVEHSRFRTSDKDIWEKLKEHSRQHRTEPTKEEDVIWQEIRDSKLGFKFRRQHAIDIFIVDFISLEKGLIVEIDGGYHNDPEQKELDELREMALKQKGFSFIRFTNDEVNQDLQKVIDKIKNVLSTTPSLRERGPGGEAIVSDFIEVFTTRPDTIFGVSFMVIAPEHELVAKITTPEQKEAVEAYVNIAKNRSERERMTEVKRVSGEFTGAYVEHPFTGAPIPVWIGDYVLAGYGTGAVMAVPAGDERDYAFAKHFNLPIPAILEDIDISEAANPTKDAKMINSDFLNGLTGYEAIKKAIEEIEKRGIGKGKVNFRLRDAGYSRQRYWGEPFPVVYDKEGTPHLLDENDLPVELPKVDSYKPSGSGESPLANAKDWVTNVEGFTRETDTMPGYAGSSWYFLRYMDPKNDKEFASKDAIEYWRSVDLYLGGSEHAVGHLLYSRMWNKFLFDLGLVVEDEPFKKLINQGMIQGRSNFIYRATFSIKIPEEKKATGITFDAFPIIYLSKQIVDDMKADNLSNEIARMIVDTFNKKYESIYGFIPDTLLIKNMVDKLYCNVNYVKDDILQIDTFLNDDIIKSDASLIDFVLADGKYLCGWEVEKMSKSKFNVVTPDSIVEEYGADTLRMYEMFLGPLEQSKPWNTNGISGVHNFLRKYWRLTHNEAGFNLSEDPATKDELKALHKTIKKIQDDIERFSFNTAVSSFMICVNELADLKCNKRAIIEPLTALLSPFAPHIAEEVWNKLGHAESVIEASFPLYNAEYTVSDAFAYPIQFNGKMKFNLEIPLGIDKEEIEKLVMADDKVQKQLAGAAPKKVIIVPGKIVNIVA